MARTGTFPLHDQMTGGKLRGLLARWREADDSYETIAYRLRDQFGITVSTATVRRWCLTYELEPTEKAG